MPLTRTTTSLLALCGGLLCGSCASVSYTSHSNHAAKSASQTEADQVVSTFLMFQDGRAEEAMRRYVSLFDGASIESIAHYGPNEANTEGTVKTAVFELAGHRVMCTDSPPVHDFGFTPSVSFFIDCASADELERLAAELGQGGEVFMPLGDYGFSQRFTWLQDMYGVSWQLNLPYDEG